MCSMPRIDLLRRADRTGDHRTQALDRRAGTRQSRTPPGPCRTIGRCRKDDAGGAAVEAAVAAAQDRLAWSAGGRSALRSDEALLAQVRGTTMRESGRRQLRDRDRNRLAAR